MIYMHPPSVVYLPWTLHLMFFSKRRCLRDFSSVLGVTSKIKFVVFIYLRASQQRLSSLIVE
jgi:hypothetical protein